MQNYEREAHPADVLVTGHFKERYGYKVYRSYGSGNWLVTHTQAGQGLYRQPGLEVRTQPGDIVLLQPGALHDYSVPPDGYWEFHWAHFHPKIEWLSWLHLPEMGQGLFRINIAAPEVRERIGQTFLNMHKDVGFLDSPDAGATILRELALNSLEEVLLLAVRERAQESQVRLDERVQRVLNRMTQDIAAEHSLETLAKEVAISPSRLSHLFKQEVGDSVTNKLLTLRLNTAARLLEFTSYSITTIADKVGFHSAFYFSRQFRQRFGVNPRGYRGSVEKRKS
ncbi:MAG TPA: helix-turn-helix domain-containing protein [Ktedonosporobacter sp.]|nr:helix-turn-helix domain-containing protein [Ktedonosporobacter sp.]